MYVGQDKKGDEGKLGIHELTDVTNIAKLKLVIYNKDKVYFGRYNDKALDISSQIYLPDNTPDTSPDITKRFRPRMTFSQLQDELSKFKTKFGEDGVLVVVAPAKDSEGEFN